MITLAGLPLLLPDSDGELFRWQEAFQAARQYDLFAEPAADKSSRYGSRAESGGVGLPMPNYPEPPDPRINTLYWPTGATRWARGYFVASGDTATAIVTKTSSHNTAINLQIQNNENTAIVTIKVFLLPPRPITIRNGALEQQLWLMPVVDERYFWNNNDETGVLEPDTLPAWTWSDLYDYLLTQAGAATANQGLFSPSASYLDPDKRELTRRHDNVAAILEAVVLSCGHRFVTKFDGTHKPEKPADSQAIITTRNAASLATVSGGQASAWTAASTIVAFGKFKHGRPLESGEKYTKSIASTSATTVYKRSGTNNIVHSSLLADYSSGALDNGTKCDDLATQIEADYTAWTKISYDVTIVGISEKIIPCGYDDSILITFGAQRYNSGTGEYEYEASTRIKSYPLNFGVESQLSQDPYLRIVSHFQDAIPAEDVDAGASGNFYFFDETGTALIKDENDDPYPFEVHNEWGPDLKEDPLTGTGANYDRVRVHWQEETERWEIVKVKNLPRRGKTSGAITTGSGTVQVYDGSSSITGYTVSVTSALGDVADDKWVIYDWINGQWEIVSAECE